MAWPGARFIPLQRDAMMLRARVTVWAGPRGGYARTAVLPILRGLLPNPPMLPKRDTDCAGVASRREGVARPETRFPRRRILFADLLRRRRY